LLDGESLTLWPRAQIGDQPARLGLWDVLDGGLDRWHVEHLLDGESLTLWPRAQIGDQPARLGLWDVLDGGLD
ncbi:hypothetical protein CTI14_71190, partial [Methylobacterium radiotolerans]